MARGQWPETGQIGKDGEALTARSELVVTFDLRVAIAISGVGKLDRDERIAREVIEAKAILEDTRRHRAADQIREEIIEDDPLGVPDQRPASIVEPLGLGNAVSPQLINQAVM